MTQPGREFDIGQYRIQQEPYYAEVRGEVGLFTTAAKSRMPVMLKGPTGCGKTRFVQYMAHRLGRPLITVACHEDLTASDLVGRYLLKGQDTVWVDGPLTLGVKHGTIVYLDEVVEARKDTTVLIHPLTDHRRILPVEKRGSIIEADDRFLLCISYNPHYQSALKDLKQSTRQRFIAIEFTYPPPEIEAEIVQRESGCSAVQAAALAKLGVKVRHLREHGLQEGASTRLLIYAGRLMAEGIAARRACQVALVWNLTDELELQRSLEEVVAAIFA